MNATTTPSHPENATRGTNIDRLVFRFAGVFILVSLFLAWAHSPYWLWFTAFVGANLLQASFTSFCPLAWLLGRLGIQPGAAFCGAAGK